MKELVPWHQWVSSQFQRKDAEPPDARRSNGTLAKLCVECFAPGTYPWFDYYDGEMKALEGSKTLAQLKSVKAKQEEKRAEPLADNETIPITKVVNLRAGLKSEQVRESDFVV
jgi:hypothetical protein